jgi:regulatory protein SWI5
MLSNPTPRNNLHLRQRQHRRQNSTPTAFEAVKSEDLPSAVHLHQPRPRHAIYHRRGLSLDTRRQQFSPSAAMTTIGQDFTTVSTATTTNTHGPANHPQHVLRESQQQRTARPGIGTPINFDLLPNQHGETYLLSPQGTPQSHRFQNFAGQGMVPSAMGQTASDYSGAMNPTLDTSRFNSLTTGLSMGSEDLEFFNSDSALSTPTFLTFPEGALSATSQQGWMSEGETTSTRRTSRRISNGIMDRVAKFESMTTEGARPVTPSHQNVEGMSLAGWLPTSLLFTLVNKSTLTWINRLFSSDTERNPASSH